MTILVALAAAGVAWVATAAAIARVLPGFPLRRANYRGVPVATGLGVVVLAGMLTGVALLAVVSEISARASQPGVWIIPLAAAAGFAALGLLDDIVGSLAHGPEHGFAGHASALARGRLTSGGLKLLAGGALGFVLAVPATDGFAFALVGGATIALSANVLNSFDLRPGRAGKAFLAGAVPLAVVAGSLRGTVCSAIGAVLGFMRFDLRERAMGGDAGANAFGAFLGSCAVLLASRTTLLIVAGVVATLQILAEGPTLSKVIAAVPPLRVADAWGRVPEISQPQTRSNDASVATM